MDLCYCTRGDVDFAACPHSAPYAWQHGKQRRRVLLRPVSSVVYRFDPVLLVRTRIACVCALFLADWDFANGPAIRDSLDVECQILSSRQIVLGTRKQDPDL